MSDYLASFLGLLDSQDRQYPYVDLDDAKQKNLTKKVGFKLPIFSKLQYFLPISAIPTVKQTLIDNNNNNSNIFKINETENKMFPSDEPMLSDQPVSENGQDNYESDDDDNNNSSGRSAFSRDFDHTP